MRCFMTWKNGRKFKWNANAEKKTGNFLLCVFSACADRLTQSYIYSLCLFSLSDVILLVWISIHRLHVLLHEILEVDRVDEWVCVEDIKVLETTTMLSSLHYVCCAGIMSYLMFVFNLNAWLFLFLEPARTEKRKSHKRYWFFIFRFAPFSHTHWHMRCVYRSGYSFLLRFLFSIFTLSQRRTPLLWISFPMNINKRKIFPCRT